ncbi:reverse transcriptase domain-containing protein [Tanacetum coccineum]|uniref:Reverse transcriptase domain-containing protein n=1 Tax=Tanacetum coccineum TaxID=301880 RepID=A0ABQ4YZ32_9ASTR
MKLILFPFSLKGAAETWLRNEPPCSNTTWDDLVSKFLNRFYPHSKTRELRKEITNFQQVFGETFTEAWERFKDLLRKCPHHGFSPLHQIDFFYNGLSQFDQDSLNTAAGGTLMSKNTQEALTIIKNKDKLKVITTMDGLTFDGSSIPHSNLLVYQEPETIKEVVEIASSQSTPLVPPPETPPLLQKDKFQALENPIGRVDHFIYCIDIVDSLCDKFPIENNSLSGNPTPFSDLVIASLSPSPTPCGDSDFLLEETDTLPFHSNLSLPSYELFCFDIDHQEEKSSGNTTSQSDHSLPDYEAFCFDVDHQEEKSSGSTTSHSDLSSLEYESFYFDLSIDPLPPAERSDSHHEEFADELAHIISLPKNKDKVFDLGIFTINGVHSKRFSILLLDDFSSILFVRDCFFLTDPSKIETFLSFPSGNEDKVFDPGILLNNGIFFFHEKISTSTD